ncbi:MAG: M1 family metallopeptidase, partial [Planctomycetota bacterium]
ASGAPGPDYWQQRADYIIEAEQNDQTQTIQATCRITYFNQSPDPLAYVWLQLDQNRFRNDSMAVQTRSAKSLAPKSSFGSIGALLAQATFDGGYQIESVTDADGNDLPYVVIDTLMRVDCPNPILPGDSFEFSVSYQHNIVDAKTIRARGGYEYFEADDNYIYEIAQWYPRMAAYTDYAGWQHDAFFGAGEFTLELGDYNVALTVPADLVVTATGTLQNPDDVLDPIWSERLASLDEAQKPRFIITPDEAKLNESSRSSTKKTWRFQASNVRDFAFAASRKFIWDAMPVTVGDRTTTAMSFYPNEAEPLWSQYSTESIAHTLDVYGRYAFEYPYDYAISVNGPVYGMEYPMICFNGPRPEEDGTYSKETKYGLISVIIHEVGHNFFPMIVNSDERQWTWMDEGLNTFLQFLAEQEWEDDYPSRRGPADKIVPYMRGTGQRPIMTGSEQILQFGNNAYAKPAAALNILRDTILGRERFDFAFRHFAQTWRFKRPTPADFFRSIEDAAGTDLDWFWRGWFYSTDHVDLGIESVAWYQIDDGNPDLAAKRKRVEDADQPKTPTQQANQKLRKRINWQPGLKDFYNSADFDPDRVEKEDREAYQSFLDRLDDDQRELLSEVTNFYVLSFKNVGGLVMPIPLKIDYDDHTSARIKVPAEIWRYNGNHVEKMILTPKRIVGIEVDPNHEIADTDRSNNYWPPRLEPTRFELYQSKQKTNPMQAFQKSQEQDDDATENDPSGDTKPEKNEAKGDRLEDSSQ